MRIYASNAAWLLFEKALKILSTFIFLGLIARKIAPEEYGILNLGISTSVILWTLASLGLDNILLKEFSNKNYNAEELFSTAFYARAISSIALTSLTSALIIALTNYTVTQKICLSIIVSSSFFYNFNTYYTYYQSTSKSIVIAKIGLISLIGSSTLKTALLLTTSSTILFSVAIVFDIASNLLIAVALSKNVEIRPRINKFRLSIIKGLWRQFLPMLLSSALIIIYTRTDQLMLASMLGLSESGIYSVAVRFSEAYAFVPLMVATAFYPMIANSPTRETTQQYFDIIITCAVFTAASAWVVSRYAIPLLFGENYAEATSLLNISIFSTLFSVMGSACTNYLVSVNLGHLRPARLTIGLIINISLNYFLIPRFGVTGAAYSTLFSQIFASWLGNSLTKETHLCLSMQTRSIFSLGIPTTAKLLRAHITSAISNQRSLL